MNELDLERRNNYIKKLVSNSRAILTGQIAIALGSLKMEQIISQINRIKPIEQVDFKIFNDLNNETCDYPIGPDRSLYNIQFLNNLDSHLNPLVDMYRGDIIKKCEEIVATFNCK